MLLMELYQRDMISIAFLQTLVMRRLIAMIRELSFDDDEFYSADDLDGEEDAVANSKIPSSHLAKIIDEFGTIKNDLDDNEFETVKKDFGGSDDEEDDITLDSLGLR